MKSLKFAVVSVMTVSGGGFQLGEDLSVMYWNIPVDKQSQIHQLHENKHAKKVL